MASRPALNLDIAVQFGRCACDRGAKRSAAAIPVAILSASREVSTLQVTLLMIKKLLGSALQMLPKSAQAQIRERYWQTKSRLLYQTLYKRLELENTLPSGITLQVASKGEWWTYNDIFVNGEYDIPILHILEKSSSLRPLTVLDLGANVGYFTLRLLDLVRQRHIEGRIDVTMVEGSSRVFGELEARMHRQELPEVAFRFMHGLVGMRSGSASMRESAVHV